MSKKELLVSDDQLVLILATALMRGDKDLCNALSVSRAANLTLEQLSAVTKTRINSFLRKGTSTSSVVNQLMGDQQLNSQIRGILQDNNGKYVFLSYNVLCAALKQAVHIAGIKLDSDWIIGYKPIEYNYPVLEDSLSKADALLREIKKQRLEEEEQKRAAQLERTRLRKLAADLAEQDRKLAMEFASRFPETSDIILTYDQESEIERLCRFQLESTFRQPKTKRRRIAIA